MSALQLVQTSKDVKLLCHSIVNYFLTIREEIVWLSKERFCFEHCSDHIYLFEREFEADLRQLLICLLQFDFSINVLLKLSLFQFKGIVNLEVGRIIAEGVVLREYNVLEKLKISVLIKLFKPVKHIYNILILNWFNEIKRSLKMSLWLKVFLWGNQFPLWLN